MHGVANKISQTGQLSKLCKSIRLGRHICASAAENSAWFSGTKNIVAPKLKLFQYRGYRGMQASEDISAGEIANVSLSSTLLVQPLRRCPFPDFCNPEGWKQFPWYVKMAVMLLYERDIVGRASHLNNYITDLEAIDIDTPVEWSEVELQELQYPYFQEEVGKQRQTWATLYKTVATATQGRIQQKDLFWAMQAVRSRAFSGPFSGARLQTRLQLLFVLLGAGTWFLLVAHTPVEKVAIAYQEGRNAAKVLNAGIAAVLFNILYDILLSKKLKWYAMIPVIDYCNHAPNTQSDVSFEVFKERFSATISTPVKKGEEVCISYGKHGNDYLLQYYGFSLRNLSIDTYTVSIEDRLKDYGAMAPTKLTVTRRGVCTEVSSWLQEIDDKKAAYRKMAEICQAEQKLWKTSLEEDRKSLKDNLGNLRGRAALEFRIEKKDILCTCLPKLWKLAGLAEKNVQKQSRVKTR